MAIIIRIFEMTCMDLALLLLSADIQSFTFFAFILVTWRKLWKSLLGTENKRLFSIPFNSFFEKKDKTQKFGIIFSTRQAKNRSETLYPNWNIELRRRKENNEWNRFCGSTNNNWKITITLLTAVWIHYFLSGSFALSLAGSVTHSLAHHSPNS